MIKRFLTRSTAITLVVSLMSTTLSFCLSGCDSKNNISNAALYSLTYTDTELETKSKELSDIYENLSYALTVGTPLDIRENLLSLQDALHGFIDDFTDYTDNIEKKLSKQDQVIKDRQSEFEATVADNAKSLDSTIQYLIDNADDINSSKCRENIEYISECFGNTDFSVTGNDFENGVTENVETETQDIPIGIDSYLSKSVESVGANKPSESSRVLTAETQLTDEMKKLADELATPLNVYLYIRNNINTDFYSGSRKGAVATFESGSGNDVDQASLLIAMLRYLDYPAKYVTGKIFISAEQALKLTLASDITTAGTILVSSGKEVISLTEGGKVVGFLIEEIWVEAYLPYTDYRGAGNNSGDEKWIPLDTSVKEYEKIEGFYDNLEEYGLPEDIFEQSLNEADIDDLYNKLTAVEEEYEGEEIVLNTKQIVQEDLTYLPLTLQYTVKKVDDEYDQIKQHQSDSITFTVNGQTMSTLKSLDIYGKRLIIEYEPETESDKAVVKKYGSIFDVPAYLVRMVPTLKLDGETVGTGPAVSLGQTQTLQMNVYSEGGSTLVTNKITAGSIYQITEDMQCISSAELSTAINEAASVSHSVSLDNIYSDEYLGRMLDLVGKLYYAQVDIANFSLAEKDNISVTRSLSVGMTGYSVQVSTMFGMPVGVNEGRLYIDIDLNNVAAISRTGNDDDEYNFAVTTGVASSCYEGLVWSELTGEPGVSTMSLLETAQEEGQSVLMLSSANYEQNKDKLNLDDATRSSVEQAISAGKIVTIHTDKVTVDDWSGFGYIVTTPGTGGGSYMISGGLNGGVLTFFVSLAYLVNIILTIIDIAEIVQMFALAIGMMTATFGTIAMIPGLIVLLIAGALLSLAIWDYKSSIELMVDYLNGDIVAGVEEIFNAGLNIIFTAGIKAISNGIKKLVKGIGEKVAAKTIGAELAEQVIKNSDHPFKMMGALRHLGKAGIADDIIKHILDIGGEEGLERFGKWAKKGMSKDILENIAKNAADYAKYTDDVIDKIMKSNGYVNGIINCINKHGDEAAKAIGKCGDDAAVLISEYGENAAKHIGEYGDEAVDVIFKYEDDAINSLNNGLMPDEINKIYNWEYRPSDELYIKYKSVFDNPKYYDQANGDIHWPVKDGFAQGTVKNATIKEGTVFKRYGSSAGEFLGNTTDPFESRSLAPHSDGVEAYFYRLVEDCEMTTGNAAPWFGSDGGAEQFVKYKGDIYGEKYSIQDLLDLGILEDITDKVRSGEIIL